MIKSLGIYPTSYPVVLFCHDTLTSAIYFLYLLVLTTPILIAEADQTARSFLFQRTQCSETKVVKEIVEASPEKSSSLAGVPRFCTLAATRLVGWEFMTIVEGVGEVSEERGIQETLLHVAVRVGCVELAVFFVEKGNFHGDSTKTIHFSKS